jgi:hypothetical protein
MTFGTFGTTCIAISVNFKTESHQMNLLLRSLHHVQKVIQKTIPFRNIEHSAWCQSFRKYTLSIRLLD